MGRSETVQIADAHCHLADLPDPDGAVAQAAQEGVGPILAVSMGAADAGRILDLRRRHPGRVLAGAGIHPSRVPSLEDARLEAEITRVETLAASADLIGEVGLDHKDAADPLEQGRQRDLLIRMLALAERLRLPVNMHSRRADRDIVTQAAEFTRRTGLGVLLHWFTHSRKLARHCADAGVFISVGPSILIDSRQAEVASSIDGDLLLVETDSPVSYGGRSARPCWARRVADRLASIRAEDPEQLAGRLAENLGRYLQAGRGAGRTAPI